MTPGKPSRVLAALQKAAPSIAARAALVCLASLLWVGFTSEIENLGPQDMVQTDGGDIHRHDFIRRFGWPMTCAEQHIVHWYVYRPSGVVGATVAQQELWNRQRIAALEDIPEDLRYHDQQADLDRYKAISDKDLWTFHWRGVLVVLAIWVVVIEFFMLGSKLLWHAWIARLRPRGLCPVCGYDLRATPERCPECGTDVKVALP